MQISQQEAALAALTLSDWMLDGGTDAHLASIQAMLDVLQAKAGELGQAARQTQAALARSTQQDLALSWTQAFGLGGNSVTPHESVARTGLVMQQPTDDVIEVMRAYGCATEANITDPADHLGVMLAFWASLWMRQDQGQAARAFALEHLQWIGWLERQLRLKQPDNIVALSLVQLLGAIVADVCLAESV